MHKHGMSVSYYFALASCIWPDNADSGPRQSKRRWWYGGRRVLCFYPLPTIRRLPTFWRPYRNHVRCSDSRHTSETGQGYKTQFVAYVVRIGPLRVAKCEIPTVFPSSRSKFLRNAKKLLKIHKNLRFLLKNYLNLFIKNFGVDFFQKSFIFEFLRGRRGR